MTLADGTKASYEYDALGRRIAKHVTQNGETKTTLFVWDGNWLVQEITDGKAITYVQHPDHAGPLAKLENGKVYHYVTDHLGTPQEMHDAQGKVVWAAEYNAYGTIRRHLAHEISNPIRFAGQYFDDETGLHYNRFRYYDPQAGRYVNPDPIGLKGGWNAFTYVSNPLQWVDLLGLSCDKTYQTYTKTHLITGVVYSGRASGCGTPEQNVARRDRNHHMNKKGYGPAVVDKSSCNPGAIRGQKERNITRYGGAIADGLENEIKAVDQFRQGNVESGSDYAVAGLYMGAGGVIMTDSTLALMDGVMTVAVGTATVPVAGWIVAGAILVGVGVWYAYKAESAEYNAGDYWVNDCFWGNHQLYWDVPAPCTTKRLVMNAKVLRRLSMFLFRPR